MDFHGFSLIFHKFHRFSLIFIGFSQIFKANRAGTLPAAAWRQLGTPLAAARRKLRGWQPSVWGRRLAGRVAGGTRRQVRTPLAQTLFGEKPYENRGPQKKTRRFFHGFLFEVSWPTPKKKPWKNLIFFFSANQDVCMCACKNVFMHVRMHL